MLLVGGVVLGDLLRHPLHVARRPLEALLALRLLQLLLLRILLLGVLGLAELLLLELLLILRLVLLGSLLSERREALLVCRCLSEGGVGGSGGLYRGQTGRGAQIHAIKVAQISQTRSHPAGKPIRSKALQSNRP